MSFVKKEWKDRVSEYPTRRKLIKSDGSAEIVTVERSEGTVSVEGDAYSAETMNDLEERIAEEINNFEEQIVARMNELELRIAARIPTIVLDEENQDAYITTNQE